MDRVLQIARSLLGAFCPCISESGSATEDALGLKDLSTPSLETRVIFVQGKSTPSLVSHLEHSLLPKYIQPDIVFPSLAPIADGHDPILPHPGERQREFDRLPPNPAPTPEDNVSACTPDLDEKSLVEQSHSHQDHRESFQVWADNNIEIRPEVQPDTSFSNHPIPTEATNNNNSIFIVDQGFLAWLGLFRRRHRPRMARL